MSIKTILIVAAVAFGVYAVTNRVPFLKRIAGAA